MKRKLLSQFLAIAVCLSLAACSGDDSANVSAGTSPAVSDISSDPASDEPTVDTEEVPASDKSDENGWAVYWYLCGSDLETKGGFATIDLQEMQEVKLPENVNVIIQTGGSAVWHNEMMDPAKLQRWLYNSEGLQLID